MANRLDPLNLADWTGGLNLRRNPLAIADNESPDMLNVDVDPRGGFATRKGWQRWNDADIVDVTGEVDFAPRNQFSHMLANGDQDIYIVNDETIHVASQDAVFAPLPGVTAEANIHGADFAAWGDAVYIVAGMFQPSVKREGGVLAPLADPAPGGWSEIDAPVFGKFPTADFVEAHAGYMFVASTEEDGSSCYTRLRWSHPNRPDAWRESDYIDLESHGGRITGIMAFMDHLLIFKTNNMWALYGYDDSSWQLVRVSTSIGCPCTTAASRSEKLAFFFSASDKGGVYAYNGSTPMYITERLRPAFEQVFAYQNVFVSWAGRRLWVAVPWTKDIGPTSEPSTTFVFDPDTGEQGAWTMYRSNYASIGPVIDGSDINGKYPLAALWSENTAAVVILDYINDAYDKIARPGDAVLAVMPADDYLVTGSDDEIGVLVGAGVDQPFESYYKTRWLHAGWPDRKKSWRRPTFICREVTKNTELLVESYRDYDETTIRRTRRLIVPAQGVAFWTEEGYDGEGDGFDWTPEGADDPTGTGADWAAAKGGSKMIRGGSLGLARSVQMKISPTTESLRQPWGVDGIVAKYVLRRFR